MWKAHEIALEFDKSIVIIASWDRVYGLLHTTTLGTTQQEIVWAAQAGEIVATALCGDISRAETFEDWRLNRIRDLEDTLRIVIRAQMNR